MFAGYDDGQCLGWDTLLRRPVVELTGHENRVTSLGVAPDGTAVCTASWDTIVRVRRPPPPLSPPPKFAFTPDRPWLTRPFACDRTAAVRPPGVCVRISVVCLAARLVGDLYYYGCARFVCRLDRDFYSCAAKVTAAAAWHPR